MLTHMQVGTANTFNIKVVFAWKREPDALLAKRHYQQDFFLNFQHPDKHLSKQVMSLPTTSPKTVKHF